MDCSWNRVATFCSDDKLEVRDLPITFLSPYILLDLALVKWDVELDST